MIFETILCIAAHPDDIELGMGGTLSLLRKKNKKVYIIINYIPSSKKKRIHEIYDSMKIYNIPNENIIINDFYKLNNREQIKCIDECLDKVMPTQVFTHYKNDTHQEHRNIFDIVNICCRRRKLSLFMWENNVIGGLLLKPFHPNYFIQLDDKNINDKINSWLCHKSQNKKYPDLRSIILKKAELWGFKCITKYAEAFISIRIIYK